MSLRRLQDWIFPAAVVLALGLFFWFGLLYPLSHSFTEAVREPAVKETPRKGESWQAFAARAGSTEEALRALNSISEGADPDPGKPLVVRPARWTTTYLFGLFEPDAPQWRWIVNSLLLAVTVTVLCALISYPLAYWQARLSFPGKALLSGLLLLPLVLPPFVGAIGLRRMLARYGPFNLLLIELGVVSDADPIDFLGEHRLLGCAIVMVLHFYPLLYLNLAAAVSSVDPSLLEAARNLGLTPWQIFRRVVLPLSVPGLVAGGSLVFVGAFTDLGTPLIFSYQEVVAQQIFSLANEQTSNPSAPALVAVVCLIVLVLFLLTRAAAARFGGTGGGGGVKGASRGAERRLVGVRAWLVVGFHVGVILLAVVPHVAVLLAGLAEQWWMTVLPEHLTLDHLREALAHRNAQAGIRNSLCFAAASTALDVVLGLACAWVIVRRRGLWGRVLDGLTLAPLAIPGIVLAFGYIGVYWEQDGTPRLPEWCAQLPGLGWMGEPGARVTLPVGLFLVLSYAVRRLPYTARACIAGLEQTPVSLEEAGRGLGAGPAAVMARITLPLIAAHVAAGAIMAFAFAMLEVSDSMILATRPEDFPLTKAIYHLFGRVGDGDQLASALGLFALLFLTLSLLAASAFLGRKWGELFRG